MGARKRNRAEIIKEARKSQYYATLQNCPSSPRKMRLVADMVRGMEVNKALDVLKFSSKAASGKIEKLLMSAIANWQKKNEGERIEDNELHITSIMVDGGRILKRLRPAPRGRGHHILKRSNHVTLSIDSVTVTPQND
ncbi:MAG: 50S ribosomal protein L22 [Bacteroidales bacterium]|jgi:large subunit ribosomal protein L22|nr:50S ribosomal protein L22 [Bacteroidales bacterium]